MGILQAYIKGAGRELEDGGGGEGGKRGGKKKRGRGRKEV